MMFQHILVPTDGTDFSYRAVDSAIDLAAERHSELLALRVVPRYAAHYFDGISTFVPEEIADAEAQLVQIAQETMISLVDRAKARGVRMTTEIAVSDAIAETIVAVAANRGSDLIVMASHGRSGFTRLFVGSETDQVLSHSKVPVLVVR